MYSANALCTNLNKMAALTLSVSLPKCYADSNWLCVFSTMACEWWSRLIEKSNYTDAQFQNSIQIHQIIRVQMCNTIIPKRYLPVYVYILLSLIVWGCDARLHRLLRLMLMSPLVVTSLLSSTLLLAILLLCRWIHILFLNNNAEFCVLFWHIVDRVSSNRQHIFFSSLDCINNRNEHTATFSYITVVMCSAL